MSRLCQAAQRHRCLLLASTFLIPVLSLGISAANAQQDATANTPCRRSKSSHPATRTVPAPSRSAMRDQACAAPRRGSGNRPAPTPRRRALRKPVPCPLSGEFNGIVGAATSVITADDIRHSPASNRAGCHRADAGRAADKPVWRLQWREDQRRPARIWRVRYLQYSPADQWTPGQRYRYGRRGLLDHSARIRSSVLRSPGATAARFCTATTPSAASSTSS